MRKLIYVVMVLSLLITLALSGCGAKLEHLKPYIDTTWHNPKVSDIGEYSNLFYLTIEAIDYKGISFVLTPYIGRDSGPRYRVTTSGNYITSETGVTDTFYLEDSWFIGPEKEFMDIFKGSITLGADGNLITIVVEEANGTYRPIPADSIQFVQGLIPPEIKPDVVVRQFFELYSQGNYDEMKTLMGEELLAIDKDFSTGFYCGIKTATLVDCYYLEQRTVSCKFVDVMSYESDENYTSFYESDNSITLNFSIDVVDGAYKIGYCYITQETVT